MVSDLEEQMDARVAYLVGLCTPIIYSYFPELYTSEKDKTGKERWEKLKKQVTYLYLNPLICAIKHLVSCKA